jgi:hypothetical protein
LWNCIEKETEVYFDVNPTLIYIIEDIWAIFKFCVSRMELNWLSNKLLLYGKRI